LIRMNKSKKGVTLVELIICCVVMILLGGACTAVLVSGQKLFNSGSNAANTQLEANVIQTTIVNGLPSMRVIEKKPLADAKATTTGTSIFFDGDTFTIRQNGIDITVNAVEGFSYKLDKVGQAASTTAKVQFVYTATMDDGSSVSGGVVLTNTTYNSSMEALESIDWTTESVYFSTPDDSIV